MRMLFLTTALYAVTMPAYAYLGPGMGAGTIAVALGILGSIFLALFAVVYYPFKRMLKRKKAEKELRQISAAQGEKATADRESPTEH